MNVGVLFGNDCVMSGSAVGQRLVVNGGKDYLMVRDASKESFVLGVNAGKFSFLTPEERHDKKKTSFNSDFSKEIMGTKDEVAKMAGEKDPSDAANGHVKPSQRSSSNLMHPLTVEGEGSPYDVNIYNLNGIIDKKNISNRNLMHGSMKNISQDDPTPKNQSNLSTRVTSNGDKTLPGREKSSNVSSMCHNNRKLANESSTIDSSAPNLSKPEISPVSSMEDASQRALAEKISQKCFELAEKVLEKIPLNTFDQCNMA